MATPTSVMLHPGRYDQSHRQGLQIPRECGCPKRDVSFGNSPICTAPPIWWQPDPMTGLGIWTCGRHRPDKRMPPRSPWDHRTLLLWEPEVYAILQATRPPPPPPRVVFSSRQHHPPPPTWPDDKAFTAFDCSICFDTCTSKTDAYRTPCGHLYHLKCMTSWALSVRSTLTCPICRVGIPRGAYFRRNPLI